MKLDSLTPISADKKERAMWTISSCFFPKTNTFYLRFSTIIIIVVIVVLLVVGISSGGGSKFESV